MIVFQICVEHPLYVNSCTDLSVLPVQVCAMHPHLFVHWAQKTLKIWLHFSVVCAVSSSLVLCYWKCCRTQTYMNSLIQPPFIYTILVKGKGTPVQTSYKTEVFRRLRLPRFLETYIWKCPSCQPYGRAVFSPQSHSKTGRIRSMKNLKDPIALLQQCLNKVRYRVTPLYL